MQNDGCVRQDEWERRKRKGDRLLTNKHRRVLGKDLCHGERVLLSLLLSPAIVPLLLRQLASLVPFALLLASNRPDKCRGYKFCRAKKRDALNITKDMS
jgi:hypothetical protein